MKFFLHVGFIERKFLESQDGTLNSKNFHKTRGEVYAYIGSFVWRNLHTVSGTRGKESDHISHSWKGDRSNHFYHKLQSDALAGYLTYEMVILFLGSRRGYQKIEKCITNIEIKLVFPSQWETLV